jgi:hypothetical protein
MAASFGFSVHLADGGDGLDPVSRAALKRLS